MQCIRIRIVVYISHLIITVARNPSIINLEEEGFIWVSDFIDFIARSAGSTDCMGKGCFLHSGQETEKVIRMSQTQTHPLKAHPQETRFLLLHLPCTTPSPLIVYSDFESITWTNPLMESEPSWCNHSKEILTDSPDCVLHWSPTCLSTKSSDLPFVFLLLLSFGFLRQDVTQSTRLSSNSWKLSCFSKAPCPVLTKLRIKTNLSTITPGSTFLWFLAVC